MPKWNSNDEPPRIPNEFRGDVDDDYQDDQEMYQDKEPRYIRRKVADAWRRIEYLRERIDRAHRESGRRLHHDAQELGTWYWLLRVAERAGYDTSNPNEKGKVG